MSTDVESSTVQIGIVEGQVDVNSSKRTRGRGKKWHVYPQKKFDNPQVKFFSKYRV